MVSVIIPTYKPGVYIRDCLRSINNQTVDLSCIELLIVLNGPYVPYYDSIKNELDMLSAKMHKHFFYTEEAGVSNARNIGLNYAQGDYILFVDDDDIISSNYIEKMLEVANGEDVVVSNVYSFNLSIKERINDYLTFKDDSVGLIKNRCYLSNACCKLIPKIKIQHKSFDIGFSQGEDAVFMFNISDGLKKILKTSPDCIYYRRLREQSASRRKKTIWEKGLIIYKMQSAFTRIYFSRLFKYNFILYLSRMLAVLKILSVMFLLNISLC